MNIGLVLSGGMAKGAYQVGALKAIKEIIPEGNIKYISASSVGALNSYCFAMDRLDKLSDMWRNIDYNDGSRAFIGNILKSSFLQQAIKDICLPEDKVLGTHYITLLNMRKRQVSYQNLQHVPSHALPKILKASVAMPLYNKPVRINGQNFYDGAIVDNIPIYPLMKHNLDYIICVYFDEQSYIFEDKYFDNKVIKLTYTSDKRISDSVFFTNTNVESMMKLGYERTHKTLKDFFVNGVEDYEYIYKVIENKNKGLERKIRISGDMTVNNINKVAQKLTRRKVKF